MKKEKETGVFQLEDGSWGYRFSILIDGERISRKKVKDYDGNKLKTKKEALKERKLAIERARNCKRIEHKVIHKTVRQVYEEYCTNGRRDKAYQTKRKQDSLWENHLEKDFGSRYVDDISVAEVDDYLAKLYYDEGYSYQYTNAFLKMFYLIMGQAYSRDYIDVISYSKLCKNKDTKIHMPKLKDDDDTDIVAFDREKLKVLDEYFKGTNAETAYLLGRYCGLRINECFGLKWKNVDLEAGTITIDRQMMYQEGLIKLVPVKTRNGRRTIILCDFLKKYLHKKYRDREKELISNKALIEQRQRIITDLDGGKISSVELVNCLADGTIQTVNSFKYPTREIKKKYGIIFKYHYLRHTYGTMMAEINTPQHLLCDQMGHGNIHITQKYYLAITKNGIQTIKDKVNML